jgi:hypothetical protein
MKNRKETQEFIIANIDALMPGSDNKKIYEDLFANMDDEQFDAFMKAVESGEKKLAIIAPNFGKQRLSVERNLGLAKKLGHNFFERIWIEGTGDVPTYLTPIPYMVVDIPLRRQAQLLVKKISIPEDNKTVDNLSGQPTGASKGSKISYPELQVLAAMKLDNCTTEMLKYRGGDMGGFVAMNKMISRNGGVSLKSIEPYATGVESTRTLKSFLTSMHLENTL